MTLLQLYLLTRLDLLLDYVFGAQFLTGIAIAIMIFLLACAYSERAGTDDIVWLKKNLMRLVVAFGMLGVLNVTIPSQKDAFLILGGYYATNNAEVQKLPDNILAATNTFLSEYAHISDDKNKK